MIVALLLAIAPAAWGQAVYRSGNTYSDHPVGDRVYLVDNVIESYYSPPAHYPAPVNFPAQRPPPPSPPPPVQVYRPPLRITIVLPPVYVIPRVHHHGPLPRAPGP